jgi:hypothetical protein
MISVGVITRGKYGLRLIENVRSNSNFKISSIELPEKLPDFIETPADLINKLILDKTIPRGAGRAFSQPFGSLITARLT